jgi:surface-anchored protein
MKLKSLILASSMALLPLSSPAVINFSGGGADLTFFYDSQADSWATVFRAKGTEGQPTNSIASGLTSPFNSTSTPATWTGIVGNVVAGTNGHTGDYTFSSLTTFISTTTSQAVGATNYYIASASGSSLLGDGSTADLGIRTRLREDEVALGIGSNTAANQFDSFNLSLNLAASTFNGNALDGNAHISLLFWDSFENPIALIDTADSSLTANFGNNAHVHRNWGFSEYGTYELVFDLQGVGGTYGGLASTGTASMTFEVVPEPATFALISGLLAFGLIAYRRRRKA